MQATQRSRLADAPILVLPLLMLALAILSSPAAAQQDWLPTVATAPGGTLNDIPAGSHLNRMPPAIDPRFFPPAQAPAPVVRGPLPQGAWSPLVTGALPGARGPADAAAQDPRAGIAPSAQSRDALTPIRPMQPRALAAAEGAATAATGSEAAAKAAPAQDGAPSADASEGSIFKMPGPLDALPPNATAAQQYCFNTVDTAADARFAWQAKKIREMEAELEKKSVQLEAKTEEYKRWLERRDAFSRKAHEKLVGFYSRMRPDAAALQLASLDEETAAAVVTKLETKVASQIMGEMNPEQAAKIATIISGAARVPPERRRAVAPGDAKPPGEAEAGPSAEGPRS